MRHLLALLLVLSTGVPAQALAYGRIHATNFERSDRWGTNFGKHFDDEVKAQKRAPKAPKRGKSKPSRTYEPPAGGEAP